MLLFIQSRFWQPTVQKRKAALIIGMSFTDHMHLEPHQAPFRDVEAMAQLLKSKFSGIFLSSPFCINHTFFQVFTISTQPLSFPTKRVPRNK